MFRIKRTRRLPFALLLGWAFWWVSLLGWLGFDSAMIDPNGRSDSSNQVWVTPTDSSYIDPDGQPHSTAPGSTDDSDSSSSIDPNGHP